MMSYSIIKQGITQFLLFVNKADIMKICIKNCITILYQLLNFIITKTF